MEVGLDMATKRQKENLEALLASWVYVAIAEEWSTSDVLSRVAMDWRGAVPVGARGFDVTGYNNWLGWCLGLVGIGSNVELMDKQRENDAALLAWASVDIPGDSISGALIRELADEILSGVSYRRVEASVEELIFGAAASSIDGSGAVAVARMSVALGGSRGLV
jgi:hypothetical protein